MVKVQIIFKNKYYDTVQFNRIFRKTELLVTCNVFFVFFDNFKKLTIEFSISDLDLAQPN